jgi:hypothetical protein
MSAKNFTKVRKKCALDGTEGVYTQVSESQLNALSHALLVRTLLLSHALLVRTLLLSHALLVRTLLFKCGSVPLSLY